MLIYIVFSGTLLLVLWSHCDDNGHNDNVVIW